MIKWLSRNIVNWQIQRNILDSGQRALYQYGYEVLLNQVVNILAAIIIAILMRAPVTVFLFLVSYIPLRSFCGGYHARTNGGCTLVSILLTIAVCIIVKVAEGSRIFSILPVGFIISGLLILWLAPVADKNKPLDEKETVRYRKMSRYIWLAEAVIGMVFWFFKPEITLVIVICHVVLSIMLVYGEQKNRQGKNSNAYKIEVRQ
ncbi:MAG: accessory gene regulator B family protein [Lacrimispora sp.]|uniref:accessory gene regulator ArgB-like protein n=1 Tax=Lacrimispora sp. TaxID=2719234 RepID=UPI0039E612C3